MRNMGAPYSKLDVELAMRRINAARRDLDTAETKLMPVFVVIPGQLADDLGLVLDALHDRGFVYEY